MCVVEEEGKPRLLRACSTAAIEGMRIITRSPRIDAVRRSALELMLSGHCGDCRPPCALACPAGTDCQGYVGLIANGDYEAAALLIAEKLPIPSSIGRVCPRPCEDECRRELKDEPINIGGLKYFATDKFLGKLAPKPGAATDKNVAVIGGGPGGLSAAYFLRRMGHGVTVFDQNPEMGGMLRYGIPEYRLPKSVLAAEVEAISGMGAEFRNNTKIGRDIAFADILKDYDAALIAVGAWKLSKIGCPG
jgi:formate dehydrogenase major subunit